jgi:deoxyribodipyrimidine photolyase-related protein
MVFLDGRHGHELPETMHYRNKTKRLRPSYSTVDGAGELFASGGVDPDEVNEWYLVVYADAYEWVELPNVTGMILFADGGKLASKPYAAGGAYINKMSNYCKNCRYDVQQKTGAGACPFNYMYWDFLIRNRDRLDKNPRLAMSFRTLDKMAPDKIKATQDSAQIFLKGLTE